MERNTTFTEGKILQPLILFAMPVLFALFLQAMYGAVDLLVVGKFASSADVSAVSTGSQIMMTLTNLISCFAMGTTVLLGQLIGWCVLHLRSAVLCMLQRRLLTRRLLM